MGGSSDCPTKLRVGPGWVSEKSRDSKANATEHTIPGANAKDTQSQGTPSDTRTKHTIEGQAKAEQQPALHATVSAHKRIRLQRVPHCYPF